MLVVFDVDGTLTRTSELNARAYAQAFLDVFEERLPSNDWSEYPMVTASGILETAVERRFRRAPTEKERAAVRERFVEVISTLLFTFKGQLEISGAVSAFERLQQTGHAVALASGDWQESAELKLERAGFELEDVPTASADDSIHRDHIIELAIQRAGGRAAHEHVVYVGDGVWDVQAARGLGLPLVGVDHDDTGRLTEAGVDDVIHDYDDYHQFEAHLLKAVERGAQRPALN